jgi:C1A family cysteine protease
MPIRSNKGYGWIPDLPDQRDHIFKVPRRLSLPEEIDLRPSMPPVYDQGNLGSCTANAIGAAYQYELRRQTKPEFIPSRLFIYYNERVVINTVKEDSGAMIRDGIKSCANEGVCPEKMWLYTDVGKKFMRRPPRRCFTAAQSHQLLEYQRLETPVEIQAALAAQQPVVAGFSVYDSFETDAVARTGLVLLPGESETLLGGHAILIVGYRRASRQFIVRNSWGADWGLQGYCLFPMAYPFEDCWTMKLIEG